ncbi:MAG: class I SAM-dependent methyltransferase [Sphingomonas sp.]|nr:class I SAM-dependent methyltransferase [Sphingomonas sp.]
MPRIEKVGKARAQRAVERQLDYMCRLGDEWKGMEDQVVSDMIDKSNRVRTVLERLKPIKPTDRVLEVGSGATGIIFNFGGDHNVGVDPLADHLRELFLWQRSSKVPTIAAGGENLPFEDARFDVVFSDNVIDHAPDPAKIISEIARVLKPGGLFYFTVNVHHSIYHFSSRAYGIWKRFGLPGEITPFADHTVHLTVHAAKSLFDGLPFRIIENKVDLDAAMDEARTSPPRHLGDRLKRLFFKNAVFEVVAVREPTQP